MMEPKARRVSASPILHLDLDPESGTPMYRQLYDGLREAILSGRLAPGARLPSSRVLAADLGVARNTVLQAFDHLQSEGYLAGSRGGGTRIRDTMPDSMLSVAAAGRKRAAAAAPAVRKAATPPLSRRGRLLAASGSDFFPSPLPGSPPFELGVSALDAFPAKLWSRLAARRWRRGQVNLRESDPAGESALREAIASYVVTARDARCTADQVLVTNGAQQAMHLIAQALLDPGEKAWIEDPGYVGARAALEAAGARLVPVPVDEEGMDVAAGERAAPGARIAYVTPSHQFPLGAVMSAPRRLHLLNWARRASAWIIEDDYDSEFRYAGRPLQCLQGLDAQAPDAIESHRVLYVGTFSKSLAPGLRLGYMVVPDSLVDAFRAVRAATDRHTPALDQGVLAELIGEGHYARHMRRVRNLCAERQAALVSAAESYLAGLLSLKPDPAGLHLVGRLPEEMDENRASRLAAEEGIKVSPLSRFTAGKRVQEPGSLLLGYAAHDERQIRDGVKRLVRALERA